MTDHIRRLYQHLAWADTRAIAVLRAMPAPPPDATRLLAHVLAAEHVWLSRIEARASEVEVWPAVDLDRITTLAEHVHPAFAARIGVLTATELRREIRYRNTKGAEFVNSLEDILMHVALHGAYHRGQVARIVRTEGGVPLSTDYIVFVRERGQHGPPL